MIQVKQTCHQLFVGGLNVICVCLCIVMLNIYCVVFLFLSLVYHMLPVSLDCPYVIAPSVFSIVYYLDSFSFGYSTM